MANNIVLGQTEGLALMLLDFAKCTGIDRISTILCFFSTRGWLKFMAIFLSLAVKQPRCAQEYNLKRVFSHSPTVLMHSNMPL